jgi:hypothetical protein
MADLTVCSAFDVFVSWLEMMDFGATKLRGTMPEEICDLTLNTLQADCAEIAFGVPPRVLCVRGACCSDCFDGY